MYISKHIYQSIIKISLKSFKLQTIYGHQELLVEADYPRGEGGQYGYILLWRGNY